MTLFEQDEITIHVLSFLTPRDLVNFGLTCKRNWKFIQDKHLWALFAEIYLGLNRLEFFETKRRIGPIKLYKHTKERLKRRTCKYIFTKGKQILKECKKSTLPGEIFCRTCMKKNIKGLEGAFLGNNKYITVERGIVFRVQGKSVVVEGIRERDPNINEVNFLSAEKSFLPAIRELTPEEKEEVMKFNNVIV